MRDPEKTISNIIEKTSGAYLSYIDAEGYPVTKAMLSPVKVEGIKTIYFSTNTSSNKVKCFLENPKASVYFVDKRFFRGVSLVGTAEVLTDQITKQALWQEGDEKYYPMGVADPAYCIIKFTANKGRYYANFKNEDFNIE